VHSGYMVGKMSEDEYSSSFRSFKRELMTAKPLVDTKAPSSTTIRHLGPYDSSKHYNEKQTYNKIEFENNLLLARMAKIFKEGSQDPGGPPLSAKLFKLDSTGVTFTPRRAGTSPRKERQTRRARPGAVVLGTPYEGAGTNAGAQKQRGRNITQENEGVLGRIERAGSNYSVVELAKSAAKQEEYKNRARRIRVGWHQPRQQRSAPPKTASKLTPRPPAEALTARDRHSQRASTAPNQARRRGGAATARQEGQASSSDRFTSLYPDFDRCKLALSNVTHDEMGALLALKRPPGLVRNVFTALMLLVSPFETSDLDITWDAVKEWVQQLGGIQEWLHNLWNFDLAVVPISNAIKTLGYMESEGLDRDTLQQFSPTLAKFAEWIRTVCKSANDRPIKARQISATARIKATTERPSYDFATYEAGIDTTLGDLQVSDDSPSVEIADANDAQLRSTEQNLVEPTQESA